MIPEDLSRLQVAAAAKQPVSLRPVCRLHSRKCPVPLSLPRCLHHALVRNEDGQSLIESAVAIPVLFLFLFCFMEICLAFYSYNMISEAAREGTYYAMVRGANCKTSANPSTSCTATATQVSAYVSGLSWPNIAGGTMTVCTYYNNNSCNTNPAGSQTAGSPVKVTVTYIFPITMPLVPQNALTLTSSSTMTILQ